MRGQTFSEHLIEPLYLSVLTAFLCLCFIRWSQCFPLQSTTKWAWLEDIWLLRQSLFLSWIYQNGWNKSCLSCSQILFLCLTGVRSQRCTWWRRRRQERCLPWSVWRRNRRETSTWRTRSLWWKGFISFWSILMCSSKIDKKLTRIFFFNNRINHDNVVGMEEFYESRTHYYLIMQLWVLNLHHVIFISRKTPT